MYPPSIASPVRAPHLPAAYKLGLAHMNRAGSSSGEIKKAPPYIQETGAYEWTHLTQGLHKFKPDQVPTLKGGGRHRLPSLNKKSSICTRYPIAKEKSPFPRGASLGILTYFGAGHTPRSTCQRKTQWYFWRYFVSFFLVCVFF